MNRHTNGGQPPARPSAFAKAMADTSATLSPSDGERDGGRGRSQSTTPHPPQADTVEVWSIDLDPPGPFIQAAQASLPPEEQSRAAQFKTGPLRQRFIVAHAALRQLLAARLHLAPAELTLNNGPHGKPGLAGTLAGQLHFSLSHSGDLALVAISPGAEVGVDVEHIRPQPDAHRLAKRFFTPGEATALLQLPEADQTAGFFRLWTRKEALVKATGEGIAHALARFEVSCDAEARLLSVDGDPANVAQWTLHGFSPAAGYMGAVAVQKPDALFSFNEYQFEPTGPQSASKRLR